MPRIKIIPYMSSRWKSREFFISIGFAIWDSDDVDGPLDDDYDYCAISISLSLIFWAFGIQFRFLKANS